MPSEGSYDFIKFFFQRSINFYTHCDLIGSFIAIMHTTNGVGRFRLSSVTRISNKFLGVQDLPGFGISKQNRAGIRDESTHRMRDAENNHRDDGIERTLGSG